MILYQVCGVVSVVEWRKGLGCVLSSVGNDRGYNSSWSRVISLIGPVLAGLLCSLSISFLLNDDSR
ncbi:hypothetical protein P167DRAFT_141360 [Morchella conica CCBAS932]|uniref:Uncharacterized protein n=1 Tax=Morchella conica CCBAS932 TaxID=1392247 RepID=A0A3N4KR92_9PEZI|nr:hypothetical protein P167DRAFT_141360 [Morchella conica CCBAS932]